jgi:hypothetical protein
MLSKAKLFYINCGMNVEVFRFDIHPNHPMHLIFSYFALCSKNITSKDTSHKNAIDIFLQFFEGQPNIHHHSKG